MARSLYGTSEDHYTHELIAFEGDTLVTSGNRGTQVVYRQRADGRWGIDAVASSTTDAELIVPLLSEGRYFAGSHRDRSSATGIDGERRDSSTFETGAVFELGLTH